MAAVLETLLLVANSAVTSAAASPDQVDELCNQLSSLSENHEPAEIYADLSDPHDQLVPHGWRSVPDRKALEQLAVTTQLDGQAFVWRVKSGTLAAMLFESESGDWVLNAEYCFDSAGTLRRSVATLNTFHAIDPVTGGAAPVSRVKTTYFASDGHVVETTTALLDLFTFEPAPDRQFMNHEDPHYLKLTDLPFSSVMPK